MSSDPDPRVAREPSITVCCRGGEATGPGWDCNRPAAGARNAMDAKAALNGNDDVTLGQVGCVGCCSVEPLMEVWKPGEPPRRTSCRCRPCRRDHQA